jgi:hypothetical protein
MVGYDAALLSRCWQRPLDRSSDVVVHGCMVQGTQWDTSRMPAPTDKIREYRVAEKRYDPVF